MKSTTSSEDGPNPDPLSLDSKKSFEIASDGNILILLKAKPS
jgi:hypothetical protein